MTILDRHKIYCETEGEWVYKNTNDALTECPNNPAHTVRSGSEARIETRHILLVDKNSQGIIGVESTIDDDRLHVVGTQNICGGLNVAPISSPVAPTVTQQGTPGSTSWGYKVSALSDQGETMASAETQIANGAATLNGTDLNRLTWSGVEGAASYNIYRSAAGGTPDTLGLIGSVDDIDILQFDDTGLAASGGEPSEDRSGAVVVGNQTMSSGEAGKLLNVQESTTDDNTVTSLITVTRESINTVLAGFGTGLYMKLLDAIGTMRSAGSIHFLWSDPGAALKTAFRIMLREGGTQLVERFRVTSDGKLQLSESSMAMMTEVNHDKSDTTSSTSSTIWQTKLQLDLLSIPAGDYYIGWYAEGKMDDLAGVLTMGVYLDDTTHVSAIDWSPNVDASDEECPFGGHDIRTLTAGDHNLKLRFAVSDGTGVTASIRRARIIVWRMD